MRILNKTIRIDKTRALNMLVIFALLYCAVSLFLYANQRKYVFFPSTQRSTPAGSGAPQMEVIAVQPADMEGSIEGWYKSPADSSKPVILYFHGDGGSIGHRVGMVAPFIKAGYGVLLAEYRGYNGNEGEPTEQGLYADAEAYLDWLQNKRHIREGRVVIYGESLGTAVAVYLAANHANIGGVILDGSFTSLTALLQKQLIFFYAPLIFQDRFDALSRIRDIKSPILFLHGGRDNVTPLRMAKRLFDAANEPKTIKVFKDGAHLDLYNYGAADAVNEFMKSVR